MRSDIDIFKTLEQKHIMPRFLYVPKDAVRVGHFAWGTESFCSKYEYLFDTAAKDLLNRQNDSWRLSADGYGINSYALTTSAVTTNLKIILQCLWGGAFNSEEEDCAQVRQMLYAASKILRDSRAWEPKIATKYVFAAFFRGVEGRITVEERLNSHFWEDQTVMFTTWDELTPKLVFDPFIDCQPTRCFILT